MIPTRLRFALILLLFLSGTLSVFIDAWSWKIAFALWATGLFMLLGHFRYGNIVQALLALRKGDIAKAEGILQQIKRPDWLSKRYQGLYHFAWGLIQTHKSQSAENEGQKQSILAAAEGAFRMSLEKGLKGKHELAIVYLNLGHIAYSKGEYDEADKQLEHIGSLGKQDLFMEERIEELRMAINKRKGQLN